MQLKGLKTYDFGFWLNLISTAQWISAHWSFTRCRHSSTIGCALHESVATFNELVSTTLGIYPKMFVCWGLGCLPCMDHGVVQVLMFVSNAVLQVWHILQLPSNSLFAMVYMAQLCVVCLVSFSLVLCTHFVGHFAMKKLKSIILGNSAKTYWSILLLSLHLRTM